MSTDRRRDGQKFSNANLNGVFANKPQPSGAGGAGGVNRGGMLFMSLPKVGQADAASCFDVRLLWLFWCRHAAEVLLSLSACRRSRTCGC